MGGIGGYGKEDGSKKNVVQGYSSEVTKQVQEGNLDHKAEQKELLGGFNGLTDLTEHYQTLMGRQNVFIPSGL